MEQSNNELEELIKSCPRCGKSSANSSNPSGRCSACLKKLASAKKKPGNYLHEHKVADDALRRQKGKNGTASKKSSGLGSRKDIIKKVKAGEKKAGTVLSPDRIDNKKGYSSSNTRMVPKELNRGRHHVDEKKLRNWKKKLKKSEIDTASLYTLMKAKYADNDEIQELLKAVGPEGLEQYIELFGNLETQKSEELAKEAALKLDPTPAPKTGLAAEVGKTHTVEVHPDIDHLYRAKGLMLENKKDKLHINEYKKAGYSSNLIDKLPKDAKGFVTPEAIDKHIASLPKTKVNLRVLEGKNRPGEQKHRKDAPEYTLSMDMHPEEKMKMSPKLRSMWDKAKNHQHSWEKEWSPGDPIAEINRGLSNLDQVGWVRVDPNKASNEPVNPDATEEEINEGTEHRTKFEEHPHWHMDEIQSDFQNPKKIENATRNNSVNFNDVARNHPEYGATREAADKEIDEAGVGTPLHRAMLDHLDNARNDWMSNQDSSDERDIAHGREWRRVKQRLANNTHSSLQDPHFKSAYEKIGPEAMDHFAEMAGGGQPGAMNDQIEDSMQDSTDPKVVQAISKWKSLTPEERSTMGGFLENHADNVKSDADGQLEGRWSDAWDGATLANNTFRDKEAHARLKAKDPDFFKKPEDVTDDDRAKLLNHLSHGHEDPQHALHSAANALARKLGVKSMSMDTPEDQAKKSVLNTTASKQERRALPEEKTWEGWHEKVNEHLKSDDYKADPEMWKNEGQPFVDKMASENPDFKTVVDKLGSKGMEAMASLINKNDEGWMYEGSHNGDNWDTGVNPNSSAHPELDKETKAKLKNLSHEEKDELSTFMNIYRGKAHEAVAKKLGLPERPDVDAPTHEYVDLPDAVKPPLPVHQINTYNKRAKKLGMKHVDKKQVLGEHPEDKADHKIQYMNLHKKLQQLRDYMAELKKAKK